MADKKDQFETYLCNYRYEGETYSIEICATSFENANARRRALQHGEIIGVLRMSVPVKEEWYFAITRFWKRLFLIMSRGGVRKGAGRPSSWASSDYRAGYLAGTEDYFNRKFGAA